MGGNGPVYMQIKAAICEKWQSCSFLRCPPLFYAYLHLHLVWCSILSSETAETLAAARVSGVASFSATLVGPSGATRTPGLLNPNQARYHLRYTRIGGLSLLLWHGLQTGIATLCIIEEIPCKCKVRMRIDRRKFPCYTVPDCKFTRFVGGGTI